MITEQINKVIQALSFCLLSYLHVGALMKTHFEDSTSLRPKTSATSRPLGFESLFNYLILLVIKMIGKLIPFVTQLSRL